MTKHSKEARLFNIFSSANEDPSTDGRTDDPLWPDSEKPDHRNVDGVKDKMDSVLTIFLIDIEDLNFTDV